MFGSLSARRFPKIAVDPNPNVGPGTYEVQSSLLDRSALIMEGSDRFEGNSSICESSFSYSQIFVDEIENEKPLRTPRGGLARQPFGRSTKENILCDGAGKSTPRKAKPVTGNSSAGNRTPGGAEKAKDRSLAELKERVAELETEARTAQRTIEGLVTQRTEMTKAIPAESAGELVGLREQLQTEHAEKAKLLEQLEVATSRERVLKAASKPASAPQALERLIAEIVDSELLDARKVLCLQRESWNQQTEELQHQWEKLDRKLEKSDKETAAAKARAAAAEQLAEQCREEVHSSQTELQSLRQLAGVLQQQLKAQYQQTVLVEQALETSQLEEQRLQEVARVAEEAMERYMEREARMAGHVNHKQKIQMTLQMKQENVSLRGEVQNLQKKLHRLQFQTHQRLSTASSKVAPPSPGMASLLELEPLQLSPGSLMVRELESAEAEVAADSENRIADDSSAAAALAGDAFGHFEEVF